MPVEVLAHIKRFVVLIIFTFWITFLWIPETAAMEPVSSQSTYGINKTDNSRTGKKKTLAIALELVPDRAESSSTELNGILLSMESSRRNLTSFNSQLDHLITKVEYILLKTHESLAVRSNFRILQELESELGDIFEQMLSVDKEIDIRLAALRGTLQRIDRISRIWEATDETSRRKGSTEATTTLIKNVRGQIDKTRSSVIERLNQILAMDDRLVDPKIRLSVSLEQVQRNIEARIQYIFQVDQPPFWNPQVRKSLQQEWKEQGSKLFIQKLQDSAQYATVHLRVLALQVVIFLIIVVALRKLRDRARAWTEDDYDLRHARKVFEHLWSMALLITVLLTSPLHPLAPRTVSFVAATLAALAATRIGQRFLVPALAPLAYGFIVFFMMDRACDLLDTTPTLGRIIFLMEMIGAFVFLFWLLRPSRLKVKIPSQMWNTPYLRLLVAAMRTAAAVLAVAILADLFGWGDLANLLGDGAMRTGYVGFFVFVLLKVLQSLATLALVFWPLRHLRMISHHRSLVRRRVEWLLNVLALGLWATLLLAHFGLIDPVRDTAGRFFGYVITIGAVSISMGDVMVFAVTVWLSFLLARLVNFVLQEDVFTRVHTHRGIPYAVSGLVRYTLISLGFLVGMAAAGFELSKLAVIVGGLGVGIGFGLQNVVNNFASGLILLFERPIQVGDTVQLTDAWGAVKNIGIRASVIRTFDGAEIIVPNGMMVSEKVTNWTLSDMCRRIEVDVGVEYGTAAQEVIDLLIEVAKSNPNVLADPEPRAYFLNFGDSALEFKLRVWIESYGEGYSTRSELAVAIQEALEKRGISVPFPQRDLHLVSVTPNITADLGSALRSSQSPGSDTGSDEVK